MKKLILLIYFIVFSSVTVFSQEAVVSEYVYGSLSASEWTELLVVRDNLSLVGYSIRDNSSTNGIHGWQGGVKFKNVDLWKNLRAGTIIVINHRGSVVDDNNADGYIEIGAESNYYFQPIDGEDNETALEVRYLDVSQAQDIIQLRNNLNQHVHALGHIGDGYYDTYNALPSTKAFHNGTMSANNSVKVAPGFFLSNYSAGLSTENVAGTGPVTKGLPNKRSSSDYDNQIYWRELRQPGWSNPGNISANMVNDFKWIELNWNAASDYSDPNEGYMIVRYVDNKNLPLTLEDGKIYAVGQNIGIYTVVGYVETLTKTQFVDKFEIGGGFECGKKYGYEVIAYRFRQSDIDPQTLDFSDQRNARGRQYNSVSFATVATEIVKTIPPVPILKSSLGVTVFCSNVEAKLESDIKDKQKYIYQWFSTADGLLTGEDPTIQLTKPGEYRLTITDKFSGCTSTSDNIKIEILAAPEAFITENLTNKSLNKDTTIQLCSGQKLDLKGLSLPSGSNITTKWIKDNLDFSTNNNISITQNGIYRFIAVAGGLCPDTSITVSVKYITPDFTLSETYLEFDADSSPEKDIIITNNSDEELIINSENFILTPSANYKLVSPAAFPINVPAKGSKTIRLRFEIIGFGEKTGRLTINAICNFAKSTDLKGYRNNIGTTRLDPDKSTIDFGLFASDCLAAADLNDSLIFISSGTDNMAVIKPKLNTSNFSYDSQHFKSGKDTINLKPNGSLRLDVRFIATAPGTYYDTLKVPYYILGKTDTVYSNVALKAEIYDSQLKLETQKIDISYEVTCKKTLDTFLIVENISPKEVTIISNIIDNRVIITENLPVTILPSHKDTINVRFTFSDKNDFAFRIDYNNSCPIKSGEIQILPPKKDFDIKFAADTVNLGTVNNCEVKGDIVTTTTINSSQDGGSIGTVIYNGTLVSSSLYKDKILVKGDNPFEVRILASSEGTTLDSIVFMVEPCNERYVLYIKGKRINPAEPVLSMQSIDFGTENIFVKGNRTLELYNANPDLPIEIKKIEIPLPFELISHSSADFPVTILPLETLKFEFEYKRLEAGNNNLLVKMEIGKPCKDTMDIIIRGITIDDRKIHATAFLPYFESIELGSEKNMPINVLFDNNYPVSDFDIRSMAFYLSFDYKNLNLRSAGKGSAIKSPSSLLNFDDSQNGKLKLTLNVSEPDKLNSGDLVMLTVKPLLGNALKAKITLDSVTVSSKIALDVETNESEITIFGDCNLENRLLEVNGGVNLNVKNYAPNGSFQIDYSVVSDEKSTVSIYNINGELIHTILNKQVKPGDYTTYYDTSGLSDGVYLFVLKNGIRQKSVTVTLTK